MIKSRIRFNLRFKIIGEIVGRASALLLYAFGARLLGSDRFGLFSLAYSYAFLFIVLIDLGSNNIITREIARNRELTLKQLPALNSLKLVLIPVMLLLIHVFVAFMSKDPGVIRLAHLMGWLAVGTALGEYQSALLSGVEKMDIEAKLKMGWKLGSFALAVIFFQLFKSLESFIAGMAIGQWISVCVGFVWIDRNLAPLRFSLDFSPLKPLAKSCLPLTVGWAFTSLYVNQPVLILSWLGLSHQNIGQYAGSAKLIDALRPVPVLLMSALFPILSEASINNKPLFFKMIGAIYSHSVLLLLPFTLIASLLSRPLSVLVFGAEFVQTGHVFFVAVWGFSLIFLNHIFAQILLSADGQRKLMVGSIVVTFLNALFCLLFIPRYGIVGGGWALVLGELGLSAFNIFFLRSLFKGQHETLVSDFVRPTFFLLITGLLFFLSNEWIGAGGGFGIALAFVAFVTYKFKLLDVSLLQKLRS